MSRFGQTLSLTILGASHAPEVGFVLEGFPAGVSIDDVTIASLLGRRRPGKKGTTQRQETDAFEWVSGVKDGMTTGEVIEARFPTKDARSKDYASIARIPRPGHADWPAWVKDGNHYDPRGGGRFSARLTAPVTLAGALALGVLKGLGISVFSHIASIGNAQDDRRFNPLGEDKDTIAALALRYPQALTDEAATRLMSEVETARQSANSVGGTIEVMVMGLPPGLGDHLFDGLDGALAASAFGVPGVRGFELGAGFSTASALGSENNDAYTLVDGNLTTTTNHAGGILGGMTTGMPVYYRVALKPTPSLGQPQQSVDLIAEAPAPLTVTGRHDPCIVLRAAPIFEAVTALTILDAMLTDNADLAYWKARTQAGNALKSIKARHDAASQEPTR